MMSTAYRKLGNAAFSLVRVSLFSLTLWRSEDFIHRADQVDQKQEMTSTFIADSFLPLKKAEILDQLEWQRAVNREIANRRTKCLLIAKMTK